MLKKAMLIVSLLVLVVSFQNCSDSSESLSFDLSSEVAQKANYQWIFENVFQKKCMDCHSGGTTFAGLDLMSYNSLAAFIVSGEPDQSALYLRSFSTKFFVLTDLERSVIRAWIEDGGKKN